jgi:DNA-binding NarL/FixJ family response regulator
MMIRTRGSFTYVVSGFSRTVVGWGRRIVVRLKADTTYASWSVVSILGSVVRPVSRKENLRVMVLRITPWERTALQLLADGLGTDELAARFRITDGDVEFHLAALFARMGAGTRAEAIADAIRRGLLKATAAGPTLSARRVGPP